MRFLVISCLLVLAVGCHPSLTQEEKDMRMMQPEPSQELKKLERFIGTWDGEARFTPETMAAMKEEMAKMATGDEKPAMAEMPSSFKGESTYSWTLNNMFLMSEGWHEDHTGQKCKYNQMWSWDPNKKMYKAVYFGDHGESGTGWYYFDKTDANVMHMMGTGMDAWGGKSKFKGSMTFKDKNNITWTWWEKGPMGEMAMEGTSTRQ